MSFVTTNYGFWEFWAPYDPQEGFFGEQKCIFDGENKLILINPAVDVVSVKDDVYSNWKEWTQVRDNAKFLPAIRTTGGDPIGGGLYTGDVYFLINGWRMLIDHSFLVDGVIFSDDYPSPFVESENTKIVTNRVSSLVQTVAPVVSNLQVTVDPLAPTAQQIRQEMDANSTKLAEIAAKTDDALTKTEFLALQ